MTSPRRARSWSLPLALLFLAIQARSGSPPLAFQGDPLSSQPLQREQFAPHFTDGGGAWESWDYVFRFPSGHTLLAQFQVSSVGPGDHRGLAVGMIISPDGTSALMKNGRDRKSWKLETFEEGVEMQIARHRLRIRPPAHHLHIQNSRGTFTVEAVAVTPAYRPGRIDLGDGDEFFDFTALAPRLTARATMQLPGGRVQDLGLGMGIAFHAYSNLADYKLADSWLRFHTFDRDLQVSLYEFTTSRKFGRQRVRCLLLVRDGQVLFHSFDYGRTYAGLERDGKKPRYPVPKAFELSGSDGRRSFRGQVQLRLRRRDDLLDWLDSSIARFVVKQFSHPVQYFFEADYELEADVGNGLEKIVGTGFSSLSVLNQPPKEAPW